MATRSFDNAWFARIYTRASRTQGFRAMNDPFRAQLAQLAHGEVLEVGAGGGQNFAFYDPAITTRVEAIEPNAHMLRVAQVAAPAARVPIHLQAAPAEDLPFADATFDCALATLVFCSVRDPARSLTEIRRVLRPGGTLLLLEHVRNTHNGLMAGVQTALTPAQRRLAGNCHLNRDTPAAVRAAGFAITTEEWHGGGIHPLVVLVGQTGPAPQIG